MSEWTYEGLEDAAVACLVAGTVALQTPFKSVATGCSNLNDEQFAQLVNTFCSGNTAPAALVLFASGEANGGKGGSLDETGMLQVCVIDIAEQRERAAQGVFGLIRYVRKMLHNRDGITGIGNPLKYRGCKRLQIPNQRITVAAWVVNFEAPFYFPDGE